MDVTLLIHLAPKSDLEAAAQALDLLGGGSGEPLEAEGAGAVEMVFKDHHTFRQVLQRLLDRLGIHEDVAKYKISYEGQVAELSVPLVTLNVPSVAHIEVEPLSEDMIFLSNTEVVGMLQSLQRERPADELQLTNQQSMMMERALNYCKKFDRLGNFSTAQNIRKYREDLWAGGILDDLTLSKLIDLGPEDPAEAKTLIPALESIPEDEIKGILEKVASRHEY